MAHISQQQGIELKNFPRQLVINEKAHSRNTFIFPSINGLNYFKIFFHHVVFIHRDDTKKMACTAHAQRVTQPCFRQSEKMVI